METWKVVALTLGGLAIFKLLLCLVLSGFQPARISQAVRAFFQALGGNAGAVSTGDKPAAPQDKISPEPFRLLKLLQRESRLLDLLMEDLATFDDATIGSSVRSVHAKARKALMEYVEIVPVLTEGEGADFRVEPGFDPASIRLTGAVSGKPPFQGKVCHPGWKVKSHKIPESPAGSAGLVLEQAEVEIPGL